MIEEVKTYMRIDGSEEDSFLASLILSAKEFIKNSTGVAIDELNDLHKLAVMILVAHWYENREVIGETSKLAFSLESILLQIKYSVTEEV